MRDTGGGKGRGLRLANILRLWSGLCLVAVLIACTAPELEPEQGLPTGGNEGAAALTLLRTGVRDFTVLFNLRGVTHNLWRVVELRGRGKTLDWPGTAPYPRPAAPDAPMGRLAVLVLPEGDYEIFQWQGETDDRGLHGDGYIIYDDRLSLGFSIKAGTLKHLGVIRLDLPPEPDYQAEFLPRFYTLQMAPTRDTDWTLLRQRYTELGGIPVEDSPLESPPEQKRRYFLINKSTGDDLPMRRPFH